MRTSSGPFELSHLLMDRCRIAVQDSPEVVEVRNVDLQHGIASVYVEADSQSEAVSKVSGLCETIEKIGFKAAPHSGSDGGLDQTS